MNTHSNVMPESSLGSQAPAVFSTTRLTYWSIRREFWENRSLYIAPLAAAALFLFGFMVSMIHLPAKVRAAALDPALQYDLFEHSFMLAALLIMGTTFIVAVSTLWMRCTANGATAASCSGSRCRFPISPPCFPRPAFRSSSCR